MGDRVFFSRAGGLLAASIFVVGCADGGGAGGAASLTVADQVASPANRVLVQQVQADADGWVVIRADQVGIPGVALGLAPVARGVTPSLPVALSRDAVDGETLFATLLEDLPPLAEFGAEDPAVRDGDGAPLASSFVVTVRVPKPMPRVVMETPLSIRWPWTLALVTEATIDSESGWLVLYSDASGEPGEVLAHAALRSGPSRDVLLTLSRPIEDAETLWAAVYDDDGDEAFDASLDVIAHHPDGSPVQAVTQAEAPRFETELKVYSQAHEPARRVWIAHVGTSGPAWVVVRSGQDGRVGELLGRTLRGDGVHSNVRVDLSRDLVSGETLWAVLHRDAGDYGVFEPEAGDTPLTSVAAFDVFVGVAPQLEGAGYDADDNTTINVASVVAPTRGWLSARDDAGMVIGTLPLIEGAATDVALPLDRAVDSAGESLRIALHLDVGERGVFEFPEADVVVASETIAIPPVAD